MEKDKSQTPDSQDFVPEELLGAIIGAVVNEQLKKEDEKKKPTPDSQDFVPEELLGAIIGAAVNEQLKKEDESLRDDTE